MWMPDRVELTTVLPPLRISSPPVPFGPVLKVSLTLTHFSRSGARAVLPLSGEPGVLNPRSRRVSLLPLRLSDMVTHGPPLVVGVLIGRLCVNLLVPCSVAGMP